MIWFFIGGLLMAVFFWVSIFFRTAAAGGAGRQGGQHPIQNSIFMFVVGAVVFGLPLWLIFG